MASISRPKRATVNDVAELAEVSYQTVSRVINDSPNVSPETRQRVLQAIESLNFQPNRAAQALAKRRTFTLEVISFGLTFYGPAQMLTSIEQAAKLFGYRTMVSSADDLTPDDIEALSRGLAGLVDGVIIISPVLALHSEEIVQAFRGLPFIQVGNQLGSQVPSVVIDQRLGGQMATQHLIDFGHRRIAEITGPLNWYDALERHEGWQKALRSHSLETTMSVSGDWSAASGYKAAMQLMEDGAKFTGLAVGNDQMALGAMRALRESGLNVPRDVSIVGYDDIPEADYFEPPLTTIRQNFATLGQQSVEYLIHLLESNDNLLNQQIVQPVLIHRQSTRSLI